MDKEYLDLLAEKFAKASAWRASKEDIDWKEIKYNTKSGKTVSVQLAYLNWAVAWRAMLEIYPDANFRIIEDALGNPVWNVNGFGFVKCAVSALGVERVETFPIMDNRNDSMPMDKIDGRDINDSIQRGLTKCVARFGVGLYIYEGKLEAPKGTKFEEAEPKEPNPYIANAGYAVRPASHAYGKPTDKQLAFLNRLLSERGLTATDFQAKYNYNPLESLENANKAITLLKEIKASYQPKPQPQPTQQSLYEASYEAQKPAEPKPADQPNKFIMEDEMPF